GCKLGEIATKRYVLPPENSRIIHLDILAEEFDRTTRADLPLWGDVRATLEELSALMPEQNAPRKAYVQDVSARMEKWRLSVQKRLTSAEQPINMARLLSEINTILPQDGILVADGGFAAHWGGLLF